MYIVYVYVHMKMNVQCFTAFTWDIAFLYADKRSIRVRDSVPRCSDYNHENKMIVQLIAHNAGNIARTVSQFVRRRDRSNQ